MKATSIREVRRQWVVMSTIKTSEKKVGRGNRKAGWRETGAQTGGRKKPS